MPRQINAISWIALLLGVGLVPGCAQSKIAGDGRSVDAPDRIPALVRQADRPGDEGLSVLIHALDDDDPAVRMFAVQALRERTGESFGYRYYDSAERRRPAIRRWRDWADAQQNPGTPAPNNTASAAPDH
ncbi:MAG: HEAT repeat domain-containing protein [Planctomycetota bacterium]